MGAANHKKPIVEITDEMALKLCVRWIDFLSQQRAEFRNSNAKQQYTFCSLSTLGIENAGSLAQRDRKRKLEGMDMDIFPRRKAEMDLYDMLVTNLLFYTFRSHPAIFLLAL